MANKRADRAVDFWHTVASSLSCVFGEHGVSALFVRSLSLARTHYPWLQDVAPAVRLEITFRSLYEVLAQRDPLIALAAHRCLMESFHALFTKLVGEALAAQLLDPIWLADTHDAAAQDRLS